MVETLTDKNLSLEEEIVTLRENVADLVSEGTDVLVHMYPKKYFHINDIQCNSD